MNNEIAIIAPYEELGGLFYEVTKSLNKDIPIFIGDLDEGAKKAVELEEKGYNVIISRGGTAIAIKEKVINTPVVGVRVSGFDLIKSIHEARKETNKIAVVGFSPFTSEIKQLEDIMDVTLKVISLKDEWSDRPFYIQEILQNIKNEGYEWLVGDNISVKIAQKIGLNTLLIKSGKESLIQSIFNAEEIAKVRKKEKQKSKLQQNIIEFSNEGIISINNNGLINVFNPKAEKILNLRGHKVIGKNIYDVLPEFKLQDYLNFRHKKLGEIITVNNVKVVANIMPIYVDQKLHDILITFLKTTDIQQVEEKVREEIYNKGYTAKNTFEDIIGDSQAMKKCKNEAKDYSEVNLPLLIYGETGTGKELFAQAIHNFSSRKNNPFVAFNCAALPEKLLESELFGYVKGAFTGANEKGRKGLIEQAHTGTLLLDEIGELSLSLQAKLLRFLEERKIRKVGENKLIPVDVRIILATNKPLIELVKNNKFREDFYYRINVLNLNLPSLNERKEDISSLLDLFIKKANRKTNKNIKGISEKGIYILKSYEWPGNVRQLENVIEKLVIRTKEEYIMTNLVRETIDSLKKERKKYYNNNLNYKSNSIEISLDKNLDEINKEIIERIVKQENGNQSKAAKRLNIGRTTVWRKLKE